MRLSDRDIDQVQERYSNRYKEYGYSPKTLGWDKGKQDIRFDILTSFYNCTNKSILDIGCGFGDLNQILHEKFGSYLYNGIDLVNELIQEAKQRYSSDNISFQTGDFLQISSQMNYDYIIGSGLFNFKLCDMDNYEYIQSILEKSMDCCHDGVAFDFLSDKVDFQYDNTFHSSPERILSIAYRFSRNIILRNDYMPFEFSLFIFKDDSFAKEDTLFNRYKQATISRQ